MPELTRGQADSGGRVGYGQSWPVSILEYGASRLGLMCHWGELSWSDVSLGQVILGRVVFDLTCPDSETSWATVWSVQGINQSTAGLGIIRAKKVVGETE